MLSQEAEALKATPLNGEPKSFRACKQFKGKRGDQSCSPCASCSGDGTVSLSATQKKEINHFFLDAFDMDTSSLSSKPKNTWKTASEDFKLSQFISNTKNNKIGETGWVEI